MLDAAKIGNRLKERRGNRKQSTICKATGIKPSTYSMYETGRRIPGDEAKLKLAEYFRTSVQKLFYSP